jgi:hypothetical protein
MNPSPPEPSGADQPSLPEKVMAIHEALAEAKVPHAIGGALALAYYTTPRATIDVDVNVFVPVERWREVIDALSSIGVGSGDLDAASLERDGQCRLWWGNNAVDLFFAYDAIHEEMRKEVRRVPFAEVTLPILSPEHLAICKAMFDRRKDWLDIEQMLVATDDLDLGEIEQWLERMVGVNDHRLRRFAEMKAELTTDDD